MKYRPHDAISRAALEAVRRKLTAAFRALRRRGYVAKQSWQCCGGCGLAALGDVERYVFYHKQETELLEHRGRCYLQWGGDGNEIVEALHAAGLRVTWDGSLEHAILVDDVPGGERIGDMSRTFG